VDEDAVFVGDTRSFGIDAIRIARDEDELAPSAANPSATARPIPTEPPVMMATLSRSPRSMVVLLGVAGEAVGRGLMGK